MRRMHLGVLAVIAGLFVATLAHAEQKDVGKSLAAAEEAARSIHGVVADFTDRTADDFLAYLIRANAMLDEKKIMKPEHRAAVIVPAANALADSLILQFDGFGAMLTADCRKKLPSIAPLIAAMVENENDRLTEFLRADPEIIITLVMRNARAGKNVTVSRLMSGVAFATAEADSGAGFTKRLQRAKIVGDREVERVVRRRVERESEKVTNSIADAYLAYFIAAEKTLNASRVYDSAVRRSLLEPKLRATADTMLADFDKFAAVMETSFKGAGDLIERNVGPVIATSRARLSAFLRVDISEMKLAIESVRDEGRTPSGREIKARFDAAERSARR